MQPISRNVTMVCCRAQSLRSFKRYCSNSHGVLRPVRKSGEPNEGSLYSISPRSSNRASLRVNEQALYLTKAVEAPMPAVYAESHIPDPEMLNEMIESCKSSILVSRSFFANDQEKRNIVLRELAKDADSGAKPFMNFYRILTMNAGKWFRNYQQHSLSFEVGIASNWTREKLEHPIQASFRLGHIIYRKNLLAPFWNDVDVQLSAEKDLQWDYVTSPTFHIQSRNGWPKRCDSGLSAEVPYQCPTTAVLSDYTGMSMENPVQKGIMFSCAMAHSFARTHGLVDDNGELKMPVPVQFIVTGAKSLQFICFQLNTLDMHSNSGVKNFVWFKDTKLFDQAELQQKLQKHTISTELENFDRDNVELIFNFLLNGLTKSM